MMRLQWTPLILYYQATTDSQELTRKANKTSLDVMTVVFSTYHSIQVISDAQKEYDLPEFDLIICDEAQRTTGVVLGTDKHESEFVKFHDNIIHLKTEKSKFQTDVFLPILPQLAETLKIGTVGEETFICSKTNQKFIKESFGNAFRDACNTAGIKKSAHGLRKLTATRAANSGATVSQLKALFGWTEDQMASLYTKSADRKRLALEAIKKASKKLGIEVKKYNKIILNYSLIYIITHCFYVFLFRKSSVTT